MVKGNAFISYAKANRRKFINEGHRIASFEDLIRVAGTYWKNLSDEEKSKFKIPSNKSAKSESNNLPPQVSKRIPVKVSEVYGISTRESLRIGYLEKCENKVRELFSNENFIDREICIISFSTFDNVVYKIKEDDQRLKPTGLNFFRDNKTFQIKSIPCEGTLTVYSLKNGMKSMKHSFLTAKIPLGFYNHANSSASETHQITPEHRLVPETANEEFMRILSSVVWSLKNPILFCQSSMFFNVLNSLRFLEITTGKTLPNCDVYEIESYMYNAYRFACPDEDMDEENMFDLHQFRSLHRNVYSQNNSALRCTYHKPLTYHCSFHHVVSSILVMNENILPMFDITLLPSHLPDFTFASSLPSLLPSDGTLASTFEDEDSEFPPL